MMGCKLLKRVKYDTIYPTVFSLVTNSQYVFGVFMNHWKKRHQKNIGVHIEKRMERKKQQNRQKKSDSSFQLDEK